MEEIGFRIMEDPNDFLPKNDAVLPFCVCIPCCQFENTKTLKTENHKNPS